MRFDTAVFFQRITQGEYNANTGDYSEDTIKEYKRFASVTNSKIDTLRLVYGEIKQGSLTVRIQNHFKEPFDRLRIGEKLYKVDYSRQLALKQIFVVSEVQSNGKAKN